MTHIESTEALHNLRPADPGRPFLLAADIDGTMIEDPEGEALLSDLVTRARAAHPGSIVLAYVTGRSQESVAALLKTGRLPRPDYICGNVGTSLVDMADPHNAIARRYEARVHPSWDHVAVYETAKGEGLSAQNAEGDFAFFNEFQAGFYWDGKPESLSLLHQRLSSYPEVYVLHSLDTYVDILPGALGKGKCALFLGEELGIPPERIVVAGDSGNDRQLFSVGLKGIIPSNARPELLEAIVPGQHFQSRYPAGRAVMEGLLHYGFIA